MTCPLCIDDGHPWRIATLGECRWILGENQGCPGWSVLVLKDHAEHLAELSLERQQRVWADVATAARTLRRVLGPLRINYECLGNLVAHVHWHVIPRRPDAPEPTKPVWGWTEERLRGTSSDAERLGLVEKLRAAM